MLPRRPSRRSLADALTLSLIYALFFSLFAPFTIRPVEATPTEGTSTDRRRATTAPRTNRPQQMNRRYRDGELLVRFRPDASPRDIFQLVESKGARRHRLLRGRSGIERLLITSGQDPETVAAELRSDPAVEFAEPNYIITADEVVPNDARFPEQWSLQNTGGSGGRLGNDINARRAWDTTTGSTETVIAVIDSGIDFTHPDLRNNQWTNRDEQTDNQRDDNRNGYINDQHGWDFITNTPEIKDEAGHGTHVAGIIAAEGNNTEGISGVMWRASLMSLRVLDREGTGDIARAIEAIDYAAANGASVINCSWGTDAESQALRDAIERAGRRGVVVVAAAGNGGRDTTSAPHYPASYDLPNVISVAATNIEDQLVESSNRSATRVHVAAPGEGVLTTKMGGNYERVTGTSASTAIVTGVVGLIKTVRPRLRAERAREAVTGSVRTVSGLTGRVSAGGIANAAGALQALTSLPEGSAQTGNENDLSELEARGESETSGDGRGGSVSVGGSSQNRPLPPGRAGRSRRNMPDLDDARHRLPVAPRAPAPIPATLPLYRHPDELPEGVLDESQRPQRPRPVETTAPPTVAPSASPSPSPDAGRSSVRRKPSSIASLQTSGILTGGMNVPAYGSTVNLTQAGTRDWYHWGLNGIGSNYKSSATEYINGYTVLGTGTPGQYGDNRYSFTWSDGSPTGSATTTNGVYINGSPGNGFRITAPADNTTVRTLRVHVGVWYARGRIEATLSDGSAPVYIDTSVNGPSDVAYGVYTFTYRASSPGQTLTVSYTMEQTYFNPYGNVTIQAAALSDPSGDNYSAARLNPMNRTGTGGEDLLSRNYNWTLPILSLPGRSGLDLGLSLSYNSLVWARSGNSVMFDADRGYPSPGFQLGFPKIQRRYYNAEAGKYAYLLITPSGGRAELRQDGTSNIYYSADGSHLQLTDNGWTMTLRATDGTQISFSLQNNEYRCTQIKDRNGNFISASYTNGRLSTVTDTLGRVINFNYGGQNELLSITQAWGGQTRQWATFGYSPRSISVDFREYGNPLIVNGPNNQTISVLTQVGFQDGSRYNFEYTSYGQIERIRHYAADNHQLSYTTYNLPSSGSFADCPRFSERRVWAENWNGDDNGVPTTSEEAVTTFSVPIYSTWTMSDGSSRSGYKGEMTLPDATVYREYSETSGWRRGLVQRTETVSSGTMQKWTTVIYSQDDTNLSYPLNPRPTDINIYDEANNRRRTTIEYTSYSLPTNVYEYGGAGGTTLLRRTQTDYRFDPVYIDRRIIGLVSARYVYNEAGQLQSMFDFHYDWAGAYLVGEAPSVQHDSTNYPASFVQGRGNLVAIRRFNINAPGDASQAMWRQGMRYNMAGSVVLTEDVMGHQTSISYADSFSDGNNARNTLAYPTSITDPDGYTSIRQYDFSHGGATRTQTPQPSQTGNVLGPVQTISYDAMGRIEQVTALANNSYVRHAYPSSGNFVQSYTRVDASQPEAYSWRVFDGAGRVIGTAQDHPGSTGGYSGVDIIYDVMGRVSQQSNPAEMTGSWFATGDDVSGWRYTTQTYDWQGRPRRTTHPNNTYREASYGGCGCAGGALVTLQDEVGRQQRVYHDGLGRAVRVQELNASGGVYRTTRTEYNGRDQVAQVKQESGLGDDDFTVCPTATCQRTIVQYDGHGRVSSRQTPEQTQATTYLYRLDDTLETVTDARGATANFTYNNRHLVTQISYTTPDQTQIPNTPTVTFGYDAAGNRLSMADGTGSVSYAYDQLSRLTSETRQFAGLAGSYQLSYGYNLVGGLTSVTDPFSSVTYVQDRVGRTTSVTGSGQQSVPTYADQIQYRAWGAVRHQRFGNQFEQFVSYTERMQASSVQVVGQMQYWGYGYLMNLTHTYYADGRLRYTQDNRDSHLDRAYSYDHVGRIVEAYSGGEARNFINNTTTHPTDGPYRQSYGYDVWDNMTERYGRSGDEYPEFYGPYTNNRMNYWTYDASGNLRAENGGTRQRTIDAAGRVTAIATQLSALGFDSDGQKIKETTSAGTTTFYLRSSVLGGRVIAEIYGSGASTGQRKKGFVYGAGGSLLAEQTSAGVSYNHTDASGQSTRQTNNSGATTRTMELDPLGQRVRSISGSETLYGQNLPEQIARTNPSDFGGGCTLDGVNASCGLVMGMLNNGSGTLDPEGDLTRQVRQRGNRLNQRRMPLRRATGGLNLSFAPLVGLGDLAVTFTPSGGSDSNSAVVGLSSGNGRPQNTQGLSDCLKKFFSAFFPDLNLNEVVIHPNGLPSVVERFNTVEGGAGAFTFGNDIYFNSSEYRPNNVRGIIQIGHELTHVSQYNRLGRAEFSRQYIGSYIDNIIGQIPGGQLPPLFGSHLYDTLGMRSAQLVEWLLRDMPEIDFNRAYREIPLEQEAREFGTRLERYIKKIGGNPCPRKTR
jgi:YD repeat-containing protein